LALGEAQFLPLARLAGRQEFAVRSPLKVPDPSSQEAVLPGWWRQIVSSQRREARRILAELMATRGIMSLLMKARNGERWTQADKEELLAHLRRMAHLSPYLIALLLPGSVLLLPVYAWWLDRRRLKRNE
jgi:hypothetical protein